MRWIPHFQFLKRLIETNYIGNPYHAHFHWLSGWHPERGDYMWYYDPNHSHGVASELGAHMIDQARWYLGEIKTVQASIHSFVKRLGKVRFYQQTYRWSASVCGCHLEWTTAPTELL